VQDQGRYNSLLFLTHTLPHAALFVVDGLMMDPHGRKATTDLGKAQVIYAMTNEKLRTHQLFINKSVITRLLDADDDLIFACVRARGVLCTWGGVVTPIPP
jgi:hypothetical protein